jgi:uncharacterized delta-60 repeat protein
MWPFTSHKSRQMKTARRARSSFRPRLEVLEDRCVPSATLDPTFGSGGIVTTALPGNTTVLGELLQPNGDIIAYGNLTSGSSLFLARYTPSGSLDTTFGSGGIVETTTPLGSDPGQAALQANGQIVFADGVQLFRYDSNGSLDTTFGSNGIVTFSGFSGTAGSGHGGPGLLILPSNGDIVVGGNSALVAYTPNGSLDSTFGSGGEVLTPGGGRFTSLALENGDIVAGGIIVPFVSGAVARYTLSGSLDTTFGSGGIVTTAMAVRSLVVQPNGQIVAVGNENGAVSNTSEWALARYNVNGTLDTTFGSSGVVTSNPSGDDEATGAALESDGLIVVVGLADFQGAEFGVYNPNGSPDANFGSGGFVHTGFGSSPNYAGDGVVIQPNGDLVIASSDGTAIALARYLPPAPQTSPSFVITGPTAFTAGTAGAFTLTTINPDGSADTGYSGTVQITSSDPQAVLPGNVTITNGTGVFSVTLETAGTQSVAATDVNNPSISGNDTAITVTPAAASQVVFTKEPSSGTAGQTLGTVEATLEDAYGNIETGDNSDQVTLSVNSGPSTQLGGTLTETVVAGNAIFSNLLLDTSGSYTLAALANLAGGGTLGPVVSSSFTVASPVSLSFGSITYNSRTGLYSETVTLTNNTGAALTGPMSLELTNLPNGVVLTDATGTTNGNPYIRFLASGKTLRKGASVSITLTFAAASLGDITFGTDVVVGL